MLPGGWSSAFRRLAGCGGWRSAFRLRTWSAPRDACRLKPELQQPELQQPELQRSNRCQVHGRRPALRRLVGNERLDVVGRVKSRIQIELVEAVEGGDFVAFG